MGDGVNQDEKILLGELWENVENKDENIGRIRMSGGVNKDDMIGLIRWEMGTIRMKIRDEKG